MQRLRRKLGNVKLNGNFPSAPGKDARLGAIYERKHAALAELKQSLLQKAFAGEL